MPGRPEPGPADVARLVDAGGDQHGIVAFAQRVEADGIRAVAADIGAEMEHDAAFLQQLPAAEHDVLLQLEAGDAVDHQPADAVVAVVDMHLVALAAQHLGRGEAARAGADDADRLRPLVAHADRLHPAVGERRVGDEALDRADGDAVEPLLDDAVALAQTVLRADAAADLGEVVGGGADLVSLLQPAFGGELQPVRDVVLQRAVHLAERYAALAAATGLGFGAGDVEILVDLVEILAAFGHGALFRRLLGQADELQHALDHGDGSGW